jgi:hypothetical protein
LFVKTPLQPPNAVPLLTNHVLNAALTAACVWQAKTTVEPTKMDKFGDDGADTVKVAWQVVVKGAQELVYVKVTVVEPPQAGGAPVLLFVKAPLQPPVPLAVASQVLKAAFTAAWVWQAATVVLVGQVSTTGGGAATVKVAWQVVVKGAQVLV